MAQVTRNGQLTGIAKGKVQKLIENRQNPIRSLATTGDPIEETRRDAQIINALHAIAEIYTSADFSKMNEEDAAFALEEMKNFVLDNYSGLSIPELREAFSLAASKKINADLRAWNGKFTVSMLGAVLSSYQVWSNKIVAEYQDGLKKLSRKPSEEERREKNEETKKAVISAYLKLVEQYKNDLEIDDTKIFLHWGKILVEAGYISFSLEVKRQILKEARLLVEAEIREELTNTQRPTRARELRQLIRLLSEGGESKKFKNRVENKYSILIVKKSIINQ